MQLVMSAMGQDRTSLSVPEFKEMATPYRRANARRFARFHPLAKRPVSACNLLKVKRETGADRVKCYSVLRYADRKGRGRGGTARKN